jgi:hypothetical protein
MAKYVMLEMDVYALAELKTTLERAGQVGGLDVNDRAIAQEWARRLSSKLSQSLGTCQVPDKVIVDR